MNLEDLLYENAPAARDALLSALPPEEECPPDFSPGFHRRLRRLTRRQRHPVLFRTLRQAAACFLALLVLGGAYLGADSQARAGFLRWVRQVYQTQIVYRFAGEAEESGVYRPGWVPEGYTEWKVSEGTVVTAYYVNTDEEIMDFSYGPMQEGAAIAITDTDQAIIKPLEINGFSGTLYLSAEPALSNALIWMDEEKGMFFGISGFLDESDMLHMAESVYLENSTNQIFFKKSAQNSPPFDVTINRTPKGGEFYEKAFLCPDGSISFASVHICQRGGDPGRKTDLHPDI